MAQKGTVSDTPNNRTSVEDMRAWYEKNKRYIERYANTEDSIKRMTDVNKNSTKSITAFSKETLRNYLRDIAKNEKNLRNLSRYLYYRSQVYYRLIKYHSNMFCLDSRIVIPEYSFTEDNNKDDILKSYDETLSVLDDLNLQYEFARINTICFREDVFYGCNYYEEGVGMFVLPLDPDYCKISGVYQTGDFSFAMNMSYFDRKQELIEYWGEPFDALWKEYQKDTTNNKWQDFPEEYAMCFKARAEDWDVIVPVFSGIFNALISLLDLEDIQSIQDEQAIYKLLWWELETITNTNEPDDWKVDPAIAVAYYNKLIEESLPDYVSAAIVPGKLQQINFDNDQATDTTKVQKATETVLNTSGGSQILNSATISGTTAFTAAVKSDTEFAISMLLPQIQAWVNRFLTYHVSNPSKVKFLEVSAYTRSDYRKELLEGGQYGLPTQLAINALSGFSEKETMALNFLEQDCLGISEKFRPMASSYTSSGNDNSGTTDKASGGQEKEVTELTDEGEATREDEKNDM